MIDQTREHATRIEELRKAVELRRRDLAVFRDGPRGLVSAKVSGFARGRVRERSPPVRR